MLNLKKPKLAFFDWDGTIVEDLDFIECVTNLIIKHFPIKGYKTYEELFPVVKNAFSGGVHAKQSIISLYEGTNYNTEEIYKTITHRKLGFNPTVSVRKDVVNVIKKMKEREILMCIISNRDEFSLKKEVKKLDLGQYFEHVVSFDIVSKPKPAPDILYYVIDLMGKNISPEECWLIGDTKSDVFCAINSGAKPFFVGPDSELIPEIQEYIKLDKVIRIKEYSKMLDLLKLL